MFKASVVNIGDANIGDTVTIHRYDLGLHYETRIRKVERDKLNNNRTRIELGDIVHESSIRKTNSIIRDVSNQIDNIQTTINNVGRTADGKNAITWGNVEPLVMRTGDLWYRDHPVNAGERQMMVYDGNAWVEQQYRADMLTGTLDARTLNVVGINVDSIVGNTSTFVQSAWNGNGSDVQITSGGILSTASNGARMRIQNGVALTENPSGATIGHIGYDQIGTSPRFTVQTSLGSHFQVRQTYQLPNGTIANRETLLMNANQALIDTDDLQLIGGRQSLGFGFNHYISGTDANRLLVTGKESLALRANESTIFVISNDGISNHASLHANLNMQGNTIINQSDIRLKKDIEDSTFNALQEIDRLKFVEYIWDKEKEVNKEKPEGRQFGIIAQYSPFLQTKAYDSESYLSVDMLKQINLNSKAIQELYRKVVAIDERTSTS